MISAASRPKFTILWRRVGETLLFNKFFFDCRYVPFLRPVFSASRVQHVSDLHPKFALRPHHVWKYGRHPIHRAVIKTTRVWYFTYVPLRRPHWATALNFGMRGAIADVITRAKYHINRFRGFGVLTTPILPFSIGLAGRPDNSVSTTDVLHCDTALSDARYPTDGEAAQRQAPQSTHHSPPPAHKLSIFYITN